MEEEILMDKSLDDLGLIKELDTLSIIQEAEKIKMRKQKFYINIVGLVTAFTIIIVNFIVFFTIGFKAFFIIQIVMSWFMIIPFLSILKKKYI